jgi:hypothetical protein
MRESDHQGRKCFGSCRNVSWWDNVTDTGWRSREGREKSEGKLAGVEKFKIEFAGPPLRPLRKALDRPQIRFALSRGFAISGLILERLTRGDALPDSRFAPYIECHAAGVSFCGWFVGVTSSLGRLAEI